MYEEVTLHQGGEWVQVAYYLLSLILAVIFFTLKFKDGLVKGFGKVVFFVAVIPCIIFQYSVFRYGMAWVYDLVRVVPEDSIILRSSALFFTIAYLFFLPVKNSRKGRK